MHLKGGSMMQSWKRSVLWITCTLALAVQPQLTWGASHQHSAGEVDNRRFVQIEAKTKEQRSAIADLGISIEAVRSDSIWGFASPEALKEAKAKGHRILGDFELSVARGGHETMFGGFPSKDASYHDYAEMTQALKSLHEKHKDITSLSSIGKTIEGRDIWALHINASQEALKSGQSGKPGAIFMGNHHAREHLSAEVPLMLARYLLENRKSSSRIASLVENRDIWIIPMVNPDGVEFDISTGSYKWWRKNRRNNGDGTFGVDLNRNYGYLWGTGGSSKDTNSDTYMGTEPFSEPETQAIRDFVESHLNAKVLLTFHTFSELVLYPWGHTYDSIVNARDRQAFETMANTMAGWNGYKPQQSSDLYITSGDTTDWAYGEHNIFAFTFELSPSSLWGGGFYPGPIMDRVFQANLKPCLYLIDLADNPYKVLEDRPAGFLGNIVQPESSSAANFLPHLN